MNEPVEAGKFFYGVFGSSCVIKAIGKVTYRSGGTFESFIGKVIADNTIDDFIIDLTEAEYIDSTNLGLLARIQAVSTAKYRKRPTIISNNSLINAILQNLGFDELFTIISSTVATSHDMKEIPDAHYNESSIGGMLLSAHRYLRDTNEKNALLFKEIVTLLEKDTSLQKQDIL